MWDNESYMARCLSMFYSFFCQCLNCAQKVVASYGYTVWFHYYCTLDNLLTIQSAYPTSNTSRVLKLSLSIYRPATCPTMKTSWEQMPNVHEVMFPYLAHTGSSPQHTIAWIDKHAPNSMHHNLFREWVKTSRYQLVQSPYICLLNQNSLCLAIVCELRHSIDRTFNLLIEGNAKWLPPLAGPIQFLF